MRINFLETVIVCHKYSDFLSYTLPENIQHFDHVVVVTHPDDKETRDLCKKYSVDCVPTTAMHHDGDPFNKGRAINVGLAHLKGHDWILHLDADIVLPHRFRDMLQRTHLQKSHIYGADRVNVYGYSHWEDHKHKCIPHHSHGYFVEPPKEFQFGARIIHQDHGYVPIGYFQLWNKAAHKKYPMNQGTAEHTDVLFAIQWDRSHRELLPEVICYHLESERSHIGRNWRGRCSPPFGPGHHHKHHKHKHGYCPKK